MTSDLTLVVTAHDETAVCGPTLASADRAVAAARDAGLTVQAVICLSAPTDRTRAYFEQDRFDHWERRVLEEADAGRAYGTLVPRTEGRHLAFLDAGDLLSRNWLVAGVRELEAAAERQVRAIAHPELTVVFDGQRDVILNVGQRSPLFTPHYLHFRSYYDSCLAPREAYLESTRTSEETLGPAFQEPRFTIETMAAGWDHLVVPDTIVFKRRNDLPQSAEGTRHTPVAPPLPAMAIDRIRRLARATDQ